MLWRQNGEGAQSYLQDLWLNFQQRREKKIYAKLGKKSESLQDKLKMFLNGLKLQDKHNSVLTTLIGGRILSMKLSGIWQWLRKLKIFEEFRCAFASRIILISLKSSLKWKRNGLKPLEKNLKDNRKSKYS